MATVRQNLRSRSKLQSLALIVALALILMLARLLLFPSALQAKPCPNCRNQITVNTLKSRPRMLCTLQKGPYRRSGGMGPTKV